MEWAKSIPAIQKEDQRRINNLINNGQNNTKASTDVRKQFYSLIGMPLQSVCTVGKFFGGQWLDWCGAMDGHKYG